MITATHAAQPSCGRGSCSPGTVLEGSHLQSGEHVYLEGKDLPLNTVVGNGLAVQHDGRGSRLEQLGQRRDDVRVLVRVVLAIAAVDRDLAA